MADKTPDKLIDLYDQNEVLALETALFIRQTLNANEKRHIKMSKALDALIDGGKAGTPDTERLIRNIKNLEEMMVQQKKDLPDIEEQYAALLDTLKKKYPQDLDRMRSRLARKITIKGVTD